MKVKRLKKSGYAEPKSPEKAKADFAVLSAKRKARNLGGFADLNPDGMLTEQQQAFVKNFAQGLSQTQAAYQAGYENPKTAGWGLMKMPKIQKQIGIEQAKYEKASMMTRKRIMDGFLEAVDLARLKTDSIAMTAAWREIAKMCGYYEPTKHKVEITHNGQVLVQKLQVMSDDELLQLATQTESPAIDAEFKEIGYERPTGAEDES